MPMRRGKTIAFVVGAGVRDDQRLADLVAAPEDAESFPRLGRKIHTVVAQGVINLVDGEDFDALLLAAELHRLERRLAGIDTPNGVGQHRQTNPLAKSHLSTRTDSLERGGLALEKDPNCKHS